MNFLLPLLAALVLEFPVENGADYHVRLETTGAGQTARLGFRDAQGRDVEPTERALGYQPSARTAKIARDGETVLEARAGGRHGILAAKGVLSLEGEGTVQVRSAKWFKGTVGGGGETSSGIDAEATGAADFAPNLLANASFEEVENGVPKGWRYIGPGAAALSRESYAGDYAVKLTPAHEGGRWQSAPFAVAPGGRLEVLFAIRYSAHAMPFARGNPVNVEFLDANGRVVPHPFRWQLDMRYYTSDRIKDWAMMSVPPYFVPQGATQARVYVEHRDQEPRGHGLHTIGWGDVYVDNISVWQRHDEVAVPFEVAELRGAEQLFGARKPPRQPVGARRNGSVWAIQPVTENLSFYFADEGKAPRIDLTFGNFLACDRAVTLKGELRGPDGRVVRAVETALALTPYEMKTCGIPVGEVGAFGPYALVFELFEKGAKVGFGNASFLWLSHRSSVPLAERRSPDYLFDMHPYDTFNFNFRNTAETRPRQEVEARMLGLLGVGGIRQQFRWFDIDNDPARCAAQAREIVAGWRREQKPLLDKYGIRSWVSFMEQENDRLPRDEASAAGWKAFWQAFAGAVSNDVEFILFGNEGLGGYAQGYGLDDMLVKQTAFHGTIRQWVDDYRWMRASVKAANPAMPVGFAFAADVDGAPFTREFYGRFPDIARDVWAMNGYVRPSEMIRDCRKAMGEARAKGPFVVLPEFGVPSPPGKDITERSRFTAEHMALELLDTRANAPEVRRIAWFILMSGDDDPMGVFSLTAQPRPAAAAFSVMTDTLGAGRVAKTVPLPDGGRFHVWQRADGRRVGLGVSPQRMRVVAHVSNGALEAMDAFGNRRPLDVRPDGTVVLELGPTPAYFVGGAALDVPERFAVACSGDGRVHGGEATVEVRLENRTSAPLTLRLSAEPHPALAVAESAREVTLAAGAAQTVPFRVAFVASDGNRAVPFAVVAHDGLGFGVRAETALRFRSREARNLLANGDFLEADAEGRPVGWQGIVQYKEGRPRPAVTQLRRADTGYGDSSCVAFKIPEPQTEGLVVKLVQKVAVKPGVRYYWSLRRRSLKGTYCWSHAAVEVLDAAGRVIVRPSFAEASKEDGWALDEGGATMPAGAAALVFMPLVTNGSRGEVLYDRCEVLEVEPWACSTWLAAADAPVAGEAEKRAQRAADGTSWFLGEVVNADEVKSATWHTAGLGVYELYVNGARVGEADALKPGYTHPQKTKRSFTYDVTDFVKRAKGERNVFAAEVSSGWWRDRVAGYPGKKSAFRGVVEIVYADGSRVCHGTRPGAWRAGVAGRVTHAGIFDGEEYDARRADPSAGAVALPPAVASDEFAGEILPTDGAEVHRRLDRTLKPVAAYCWKGATGANDKAGREKAFGRVAKTRTFAPGETLRVAPGETLVVDFGQNCAAVPRLTMRGRRDAVLTCLPGEMLNDANGERARGNDGPAGSVYRENLRIPETGMRLVYTFAGDDVVTYMPRFTYYGYRYVSITATAPVEILEIASIPLSSVARERESGRIETGDAAVNQLVSNIYWTQLSGYVSVPTDCAQRNERLGWAGDAQIFSESGSFNADVLDFFRKWMRDVRDTQVENGGYARMSPPSLNDHFAKPEPSRFAYADAGVLVPAGMFLQYGDRRIVDENWDAMERFVARIAAAKYRTCDMPECDNYHWGDWLSLTRYSSGAGVGEAFKPEYDGFIYENGRRRPSPEMVTYWHFMGGCYWIWDAQAMAWMAEKTGRAAAAAKYRAMEAEARAYVKATYFQADGTMLPIFAGMQTPALFALRFGLVEGEAKAKTVADLAASVAACGGTLHTGILGTAFALQTMSENGLDELACSLLLNHRFPGWLYSVDQGATTLWERWNGYTRERGFGPVVMNSYNHCTYGVVLAWLYKSVAGIRPDPAAPGFGAVILKPRPDRRLGHVTASYRTPHGLVKSAWRYEGDTWIWDFTTPVPATVVLPASDTPKSYAPGTYHLTLPARGIQHTTLAN